MEAGHVFIWDMETEVSSEPPPPPPRYTFQRLGYKYQEVMIDLKLHGKESFKKFGILNLYWWPGQNNFPKQPFLADTRKDAWSWGRISVFGQD